MPLTHCDVMLQHKYFHTHYSTTGNATDTIVITCTLPQWEPGGLGPHGCFIRTQVPCTH